MGSEMCIRDRVRHGGVRRSDQFDAAQVEIDVGAANRDDGRVETCLLYTSDAADERSSVDLGGRRIIKKKKCKKARHGTQE